MELASVIGLPLGVGVVLLGLLLEGGHLHSIMGLSAFIIVIGGAFGASMLETPFDNFKQGLGLILLAFKGSHHHPEELVEQVTKLAGIARKDGLLALEKERENIKDPLLKEALRFAIDGLEPNLVSAILESRTGYRSHNATVSAKFWMSFAGYCPTVGILGAVLGLIHVMENLDNPAAIGPGIATAFIATVYGVGFSNLVFMPIGNKLKALIAHDDSYYEMVKVGVKGIQQGTSPSIIASHLMAIVDKEAKEE
ncbi:MAG: MotA/TolQ/ExbB proton channel [Bacteriovoracaceae bacterium]|nr:MotA/TolQ/ExbB proton channel [Bacteriovoracaceae bacterium]